MPIHRPDGGGFNGVPHHGACTVRLNKIDVLCKQIGFCQDLSHQLGLTVSAGNGDTRLARTVSIDTRCKDYRLDIVAIGDCLCQRLEEEHRPTLGAHITIARSIEGLATPIG